MLGAYTFWDAMWTMIVFFAWIMFITWVILLMIDNFRRTDHSGWSKALWALFIIFLPIIGAFSYTIARPSTAGDYGYEPQATRQARPTSTAAELAKLNDLRTRGSDQRRGVRGSQGEDNRGFVIRGGTPRCTGRPSPLPRSAAASWGCLGHAAGMARLRPHDGPAPLADRTATAG